MYFVSFKPSNLVVLYPQICFIQIKQDVGLLYTVLTSNISTLNQLCSIVVLYTQMREWTCGKFGNFVLYAYHLNQLVCMVVLFTQMGFQQIKQIWTICAASYVFVHYCTFTFWAHEPDLNKPVCILHTHFMICENNKLNIGLLVCWTSW